MKNLQSYDEFLNESNELIKAQGSCKNAIFQIQKDVDKFFGNLQSSGYLKNYSSKVKPYNTGYELTIDVKQDYKGGKPTDKEEFIYNFISANNSLYLQPDTWFEENLLDKTATKISGKGFLTPMNQKNYKDKYPEYPITSKQDIDGATKAFIKHIKNQIIEVEEYLNDLKIL